MNREQRLKKAYRDAKFATGQAIWECTPSNRKAAADAWATVARLARPNPVVERDAYILVDAFRSDDKLKLEFKETT